MSVLSPWVIVFSASPASLPVYRMSGWMLALEDAEAQRHVAALVHGDAAHPAEARVGRIGALLEDAEVAPLAARSSYQRTPTELPAVTLWLTTSDSWSPKLR